MSRTWRYVIAGASVAGFVVVRVQRQLDRVMEQAFRMEAQDLP